MPSQLDKATLRILICGGTTGQRNKVGRALSSNGYFGRHGHVDTVPEALTVMRSGVFALTLCFPDVEDMTRLINTTSTDEQLKGFPVIVVSENDDDLLRDILRATLR